MKWPIFKFEDYKDDSVLIWNTLNDSLIELTSEEKQQIDECLKNDILNENTELLVKEGFIISNDFEEKNNFINLLKTEVSNDYNFVLHILPTTGCNFKCSYCYQDGIERQHILSVDDVKIICKNINLYINKYKEIKNLKLILHGGKPTINWNIVSFMLNYLQSICDSNKINLMTSIVSNGYELTPEKVEFLKYYNFYRFQVTLDGVEEVHNSRRKLKNGKGTFNKIIENIEYIINNNILEKIDIRINYDKSNYNQIPLFLDYLSKKEYKSKLNISLGYISQTVESDAREYIDNEQFSLKEHEEKI